MLTRTGLQAAVAQEQRDRLEAFPRTLGCVHPHLPEHRWEHSRSRQRNYPARPGRSGPLLGFTSESLRDLLIHFCNPEKKGMFSVGFTQIILVPQKRFAAYGGPQQLHEPKSPTICTTRKMRFHEME